MDYDGQSESGRITKSSMVGNVFIQGPSYERPTKPIYLRTSGTYKLGSGSRVYVNDDYAPDSGSSITAAGGLHGRQRGLGPAADLDHAGVEHRPDGAQDRQQRGVQPRARLRRRASRRSRQRRPRIVIPTSRTATAASSTASRRTAPPVATAMRAAGRGTRSTRAGSRCRRIRTPWPSQAATPTSRTGCTQMDQTLQGTTSSQARRRRHRGGALMAL